MLLYDELRRLDVPIRVGLVGAGFMGKGIVEVTESAPGMEVVAVCDTDIARADDCFESIGVPRRHEVKSKAEADGARNDGGRVITDDYRVIASMDAVDMVIEATGVPAVGADVAFRSITHGKHVGMLNVETDVTCGYYLSRMAESTGVGCTYWWAYPR